MRARLSHRLHTVAPGVILLLALIFAPLFWGCTKPLGITILNLLMLGATTSWTAGMLGRGRWHPLPRVLIAVTTAILGLGWFMVWNAHSTCEATTDLFVSRGKCWAALPGSVDFDGSYNAMTRLTGLLGATLIAAWLGGKRVWQYLFIWAMATTAGAVALLGCCQRWTRAMDIFWGTERRLDFFFSTYRNVTNAGEFLNLALPLAASLLLGSVLEPRHHRRRALATVLFALIAAGAVVCGSRLAPLVAVTSMLLLVATNWKWVRLLCQSVSGRERVVLGSFLVVIAATIVAGAGLEVDSGRWAALFKQSGTDTLAHRWAVDRVCWLAAPDAGVVGFGSGSFQSIFPYYSARVAADLTGFWTYAHDDYAQTVVEWGWLGALLWGVYLWGGIGVLCMALRGKARRSEDRTMGTGIWVSLVMVSLSAFVDFPMQIASIQLDVAILLGLAWGSLEHLPPCQALADGDAEISLRKRRVDLP